MDWVHTGLDIVGFIPGVGDIADGVNAVIYLCEGDYVNAALSATSMIPVVGDAVSKGGKAVKTAIKHTDDIVAAGKQIAKQAGKAPGHPEVDVPMELHHKNGRNIPNPHAQDNLQQVWPWEHAEIDSYRHYSGPIPGGD